MRFAASSLLIVSLCAMASIGQNVPTGFVVETVVASGLDAPMDFAHLADGRVLVIDQDGTLHVLANGTLGTVGTIPSVFLDPTEGESGVQSMCVDPAFATNGYIYVWYSYAGAPFMRLDRFTLVGDRSNGASTNLMIASQYVILDDAPNNNFEHNGGTARFGPDGKLYLCIGDDFNHCTAQSRQTLAGVVLRMDVSLLPAGAGGPPVRSLLDPGDNPWSGATNLNERLVIGYGLRNPFGMNIDPVSGDVFLADVGHDLWEELDRIAIPAGGSISGANFGWPFFEGNHPWNGCSGFGPGPVVAPIFEYSHATGGVSIMAGGVVRNLGGAYDFGPAYEGNVFVSDYLGGQFRRLVNNGGTWSVAPPVPGQPSTPTWGTGFVGATHFDQGPDGAIWFVQHAGPYVFTGGFLKRIRPAGPPDVITVTSGDGQIGRVAEPFAQPLFCRIDDAGGQPRAGVAVTFQITSGDASFLTPAMVTTNAAGLAGVIVSAGATGGPITVEASTPTAASPATYSLFARDLAVAVAPDGLSITLSLTNTSPVLPATVPLLVLGGLPQSPFNTAFGPLCVNPFDVQQTMVIEDGFGFLTGATVAGGTGTPSLTNVYPVNTALLAGFTLLFQAVGYDSGTGEWFITDCETVGF